MELLNPEQFGTILKNRRKAQGFDQSDLGSYISVSDRTVRNIENGSVGTKTQTVLQASKELGLTLLLKQANQKQAINIRTLKQIGQTVRSVRKCQKISQDDLAAIVGMQHSVLGKIEKGDESVAIGKVLAVLQELGLRLSTKD